MDSKQTKKKRTAPENRQRDHYIGFHLNDEEYNMFYRKYFESGYRSKQAFILYMLGLAKLTPPEIAELRGIEIAIDKLMTEYSRIGNNINQIARQANTNGETAKLQELRDIKQELNATREETDEIWASLRSILKSVRTLEA